MTDPDRNPAPTFPRLYVPPEDALGVAELSEPVTLPFEFHNAPPPGRKTAVGTPGTRHLVLLQGSGEDLPLGLFEDRAGAELFAAEVRDNPTAHAERYFAVVRPDVTFFTPHWLAVTVVEFHGPTPTAGEVLFDLD